MKRNIDISKVLRSKQMKLTPPNSSSKGINRKIAGKVWDMNLVQWVGTKTVRGKWEQQNYSREWVWWRHHNHSFEADTVTRSIIITRWPTLDTWLCLLHCSHYCPLKLDHVTTKIWPPPLLAACLTMSQLLCLIWILYLLKI